MKLFNFVFPFNFGHFGKHFTPDFVVA